VLPTCLFHAASAHCRNIDSFGRVSVTDLLPLER